MNEYLLFFFFTLTNIPLYYIIFQLVRDRQVLQNEVLTLYDQSLQEKCQRRHSDESDSDQNCLEEVDGDEVLKQKWD